MKVGSPAAHFSLESLLGHPLVLEDGVSADAVAVGVELHVADRLALDA